MIPINMTLTWNTQEYLDNLFFFVFCFYSVRFSLSESDCPHLDTTVLTRRVSYLEFTSVAYYLFLKIYF